MSAGGSLLRAAELEALGLEEKARASVLGNEALHSDLSACVAAAGDRPVAGLGNLLLVLVSKLKPAKRAYLLPLAEYVFSGGLCDSARVNAAASYVNALSTSDGSLDTKDFEDKCGVGLEMNESEILQEANRLLEAHHEELVEDRYHFSLPRLLGEATRRDHKFKFVGKELLASLESRRAEILGPKTAEDEKPRKKKKKGGKKGGGKQVAPAEKRGGGARGGAAAGGGKRGGEGGGEGEEGEGGGSVEDVEEMLRSFRARDLEHAVNSPELLAEHAKATGGVCRTRFPPEPNGYLHIGHAKSCNLNFDLAFKLAGVKKGHTIFRYDDTNPEAESHEFIESQADSVSWLGWHPVKTTFSSDYFDELYALAERLIREGKAFVCHQTREEMEQSRVIAKARDGRSPESPWRDRPVAESLREFRRMRDGCYGEGEATLRLKVDMRSTNPTMWDPVAYRIKFTPHPRTGDRWCIYPSYDYTHCLVDSMEHIDFSLCTLEFEVRRDIYYWILNALDMWRPNVWEFSKLQLTHTILSKRRIRKLVTSGTCRGWDDPRLLTVNGMRRRGFTAEALNAFCTEVGVTRSANTIPLTRLEQALRIDLDPRSPRIFLVTDPLLVTITNLPASASFALPAPLFPKEPEKGKPRTLTLGSKIWIEQSDFRLEDEKGYFGLAPGKTVGLRYGGNLKCTGVVRGGAGGRVVEITAEYEHERSSKPKGNIHWLPFDAPRAEARLYNPLFSVPNPGERTGNWEDDVNPHSEVVCQEARVEPGREAEFTLYAHFQAERLGFFTVDKDSTPDRVVLNRAVTLKESKGAKAVKK